MAEEFQKRPFARLLILWISGICIATYVPLPAWMGIGTAWFLFLLLQMTKQSGARLSFASRGNWGIVFATLFLCLSVGYVRYRLRLEGAEELPAWQIYFREWQVRLLASLDVLELKEQDKNVLATLTLGYRQHLDWTVRERFNFSGAAHILSVSGFHVGVVYAFLRTCLFFLPERMLFRYVKQTLLLAGIWIFTLLAGMESPAVRSALMLSFYLVGKLLVRRTDSYNTWAASAFCMLVYNPFYLFDLGFELSYLAVLSILFFYRRIRGWFSLRNPGLQLLWDWVAVSAAAQIGTLPLCFYYFGQISSVSMLVALPVTIYSMLLIPCALCWIVLYQFGCAWGWVGTSVAWLTASFCHFIDRMGRIPPLASSLPFTPILLALSYLTLIAFSLYLYNKEKRHLFATLSFLLLFSLALFLGKHGILF